MTKRTEGDAPGATLTITRAPWWRRPPWPLPPVPCVICGEMTSARAHWRRGWLHRLIWPSEPVCLSGPCLKAWVEK